MSDAKDRVYAIVEKLGKPFYDDGNGRVIYCGDCLRAIDAVRDCDLFLLDLPYGIGLKENGRNGYNWEVANDSDQSFGIQVLSAIDDRPTIAFASPTKPWPGKWRQYLVWDKGPTVGGGGDPATCWKMTWELIQVRNTPPLTGKRDEAVLKFHVTQRDYALHPCQKPVSLLRYLIEKTAANGVICDLTCGSGSAIRAAKDLGACSIGFELRHDYCEIAADRLRQNLLAFA